MKRFVSVLFALLVFAFCNAETKDSTQTISNETVSLTKNSCCTGTVCSCGKNCKCPNCSCKKDTCKTNSSSHKKDTISTYVKIHKVFKNQTFYTSLNESFSSLKDLTTGWEFGSWGVGDNPICLSVIVAFNHNLDSKYNNVFIGGKAYYYFFQKDPYGMYVYVSPQFKTYNSDPTDKKFDFLFEYGVGGYYQPNKHFVFQVGICAQTIYSQMNTSGGKSAIPALGVSFSYLK